MYHILSLSFGSLAWIFGGWGALRGKFGGFSFASLSLCAISLMLQLLELNRLAEKEDFSAFLDTIGAVSLAAGVLITLTLVFNGIALLRQRGGGS